MCCVGILVMDTKVVEEVLFVFMEVNKWRLWNKIIILLV